MYTYIYMVFQFDRDLPLGIGKFFLLTCPCENSATAQSNLSSSGLCGFTERRLRKTKPLFWVARRRSHLLNRSGYGLTDPKDEISLQISVFWCNTCVSLVLHMSFLSVHSALIFCIEPVMHVVFT